MNFETHVEIYGFKNMNILAAMNTGLKTGNPVSSRVSNRKNSNSSTRTSIFYANDIHGQIPKMQRIYAASLQHAVNAKKDGADALRLCSGDTFIGSDEKRDSVAAKFLDLAKFDAQALGNHEFDITVSVCGKLLKDSDVKVLGMNLNFPEAPSDLSKKVLRSTIVEGEHGEKYGLIGLQPPDMNSRIKDKKHLEGITIDDYEQTKIELQQEVNKLKAQGLNKIILLSHTGNKFEKEIAQTVSGIDVILGGHSHDLIYDVVQGENLFYSPEGEPVVITQAGRDGNHFGVLNLEFNDKGQITYVQNNVIETNTHAPNMIISKAVDGILGESKKIGTLRYVDPLPANNIMEENPWADFVADALRHQLDSDIVLINSANFRGSVDLGTVTELDISSIFPFNNKLFKVKINEKDLVDAIKLGGKTLSSENKKPGIIQVSGLTYTLDAQGNLTDLCLVDKMGKKTPIDVNNPNPNKYICAIYDEFMLKGGDNMDMLKRKDDEIIERYPFDKDKPTIDYIQSLPQPFDVRKDGRIQILM